MIPDWSNPKYVQYMNSMGAIADHNRRGKEHADRVVKEGKECPHEYRFKEGSTVELGSDAGWFCKWCGKEQR